jgi:hypothetical protein
LITIDRVLTWAQNQGISPVYEGAGPDFGAYEFEPSLKLQAAPGDQAIDLSWTVDVTLPTTTTWSISYDGPVGALPSPIVGLAEPTRAYTLAGLTNYAWYTITLITDPSWLTDTVTAMPTDHLIYLPLAARK